MVLDLGTVFASSLPLLQSDGPHWFTWVAVGIGAYWLAILFLKNRNLLPEYFGTMGPILTIHTKRGRMFLEKIARPKRFWRAWSNIGAGVAIVVMVGMFFNLVFVAVRTLTTPELASSPVREPRNVVPIPGVNDFLPVSATPEIVLGVFIGLVVHEVGHGVLCRVEDIDINSMGLVTLAILPIGAFVEPDQESQKNASRGGKARMFAAGVTNNFVITIIVFALLFGPVAASIAVAPGAAVGAVAPGSPAANAGIQPNDRITSVDGTPLQNNEELGERLEATDGNEVTVELNNERTVSVQRALFITEAIENGPTGLSIGDKILAVDGQNIATEDGFYDAVGEDDRVTLTIAPSSGEEPVKRTVPIGAAVSISDDGPLAKESGPTSEIFVITRFDGTRIHKYDDLEKLLEESQPGQEVSVVGYFGDSRETFTVTLGENPRTNSGFLGITAIPGTSGVSVNDIGVQLYPADTYLSLLGGSSDSQSDTTNAPTFLERVGIALILPISGILDMLPFNFAGFTGGVQNFYEIEGPLSVIGESLAFFLANLLFWTGWINLNVGIFNCIPAFPLDGGHLLRMGAEAITSRLPISEKRAATRAITTSIGLIMLTSLMLMIFGPQLLS